MSTSSTLAGRICLGSGVAIFDLDFDAIISAMYALSFSAEGDRYWCVPPDPGIAAAALGASVSGTPPGTAPSEALHTFTLDSGTSHYFFRDITTFTPLFAPVPVRLADPSGGLVVARSSTVLPCPAVPSSSLSGLHLPLFSTNLVSDAALQDAMVTTTTSRGSSLYTLTTGPPQVAASAQVSASGQVAATCLCRLLSHQTLLWHHRLGHLSLPRLRCMHSRLLVSGLPRSVPPLPPSPAPRCLPCVKGRQRAAPHSSSFPPTTAPLQTLHMDVWGSAHVSGQGRELYFLLVVDDYTRYTTVFSLRSKGEVVDVLIPWIRTVRLQLCERFGTDLPLLRLHFDKGGRSTSMIHAAVPHFLWPFAVWYTAHQLNLWPRVSLLETLPTLRWTEKVGDASVFRIKGSRAFVHDTSAEKLSARAIPCVFLDFVPDAPGWQFCHPTSRCVVPSQDVMFDESVLFYHLFPYRSAPPPPPPLFLAPAVGSGAARGAASGGAACGGVGSEEGAESRGAEPRCAASSGGPAGASPRLSSQQLRAGDTGAGGAADTTGACGTGGTAATGPGGARTSGAGAARTGGVGCAGAGDPTEPGGAGAGGTRVGGPGARGAGAAGAEVGGTGARGAGAARAGAVDPGTGGTGGSLQPRPYFVPLLQQVNGVPSSTGSPLPAPSPYTKQSGGLTERREPASCPVLRVRTARCAPRSRPPLDPGAHTMALRPSSVPLHVPLPAPLESSLPECAAAFALVAELLDFAAACSLDYATALVAESECASPPSVGGECALGTDVLEDKQEDFECLAAAVPCFASMLLAPEGDPDAPDIPTPRSYAEAITDPYSFQWQAAMDAEMASWKSTGTYVDKVPLSRTNIVDGMWIFRVKRPPGSPPAFKARYIAQGFSRRQGVDYYQTFSPTPKMTTLRVLLHVAAQCDYELHSQDFSTAFLQGSLHDEIWLRRPLGFTGTFPTGTKWSLCRSVYGLRQAPREWHNTLRTTLAALGFAPSTADPSLFLRTGTSLPPFYVLVYVDELVFATANTEALNLVKARCTITLTQSHMVHQVLQRFGFQFSSPQPTPLSTSHSLSAPPSDESVEPSGPYPELVGYLMYLMTCTRPDLAYPLSLLARYVAPGRHQKVHWDAAKRVLRYLCSTSGMGLVLGGRGPVVLTGNADASWVDDSATQRSSSCEAEIYEGAMAAQELCWLIYLLTDMEEQPCLPSVLTKNIALQYFLARELQHRGQLRLAYVATRANTADVFSKALPPGDHQRFATVLGLVPTLPQFLSA
ncbi:unnamed protein product [Closterium sp. NIES-53]